MPSLADALAAHLRKQRGGTTVEIGAPTIIPNGGTTAEVGQPLIANKYGIAAEFGKPQIIPDQIQVELGKPVITSTGTDKGQRMSARRQQLMASGMSAADAIQQMSKEGLIDPRMLKLMMKVPGAISG